MVLASPLERSGVADDDRDWDDPPLSSDCDDRSGVSSSRLRVRIACSIVVFGTLLLFTADYAIAVIDVLWPPGDSLSRWATLVLLQLFGYVLIPLLVGGLIGDRIYDRYLAD